MQESNSSAIYRLGAVCLLSLSLTLITATVANSTDDDWMHDVTALTIASSGAWGAATKTTTGAAIAGAIADCRARADDAVSDCGALQHIARSGWMLAHACGDRAFIVSGPSLPQARIAA